MRRGSCPWLLLLVLLPLCSCAATLGKGPFAVPVDSDPQGAIVSYRGANVGRTPCTVSMRSDCHKLTLTLDGHHPQEVIVSTTSNGPLVLLGILLWGPFELIVDAAANAWESIDTYPLSVPLTPSAEPAPRPWFLPGKVWRDGENYVSR